MEAVKQGSAAVAIKSATHAVAVALKRAPSELSDYQKKVFEVDQHAGVIVSGLSSDARVLARFMQTECMGHKYAYDVPLPVSRLVALVGDRMQRTTIGYVVGRYLQAGFNLRVLWQHVHACCLPSVRTNTCHHAVAGG
jgi:20S proteasome subunit alpha 6